MEFFVDSRKSMFELYRLKLVGVDTEKSKDRPSHANVEDGFGTLLVPVRSNQEKLVADLPSPIAT